MADILRITTPLISRNAAQLQPKQASPNEVFSLHDLTRVVKPNPQSELLMQNNTISGQAQTVSAFVELLRNPDVMSGYTNSILLLMEVVGLLPLNNRAATPEISQMLDALYVPPDEIVPELLRQEKSSSVFKGEFFDFLRSVINKNGNADTVLTALRLLNAVNSRLEGRHALRSVANGLEYLSETLSPSGELSEKLAALASRFRSSDAPGMLTSLKADLNALFREVEMSILYNTKIEKLLPLILYNLSRYNQNPDAVVQLGEQFIDLLEKNQDKLDFLSLLRSVLMQDPKTPGKDAPSDRQLSGIADAVILEENSDEQASDSRVMEALTKLIAREYDNETLTDASKAKLDVIINSLLSSPNNFTPLLHFILPLQYDNIQSYAEIWINPNGREEAEVTGDNETGSDIHFLVVFEIGGIGRFEAEMFVHGQAIDFLLLCPEEYHNIFADMDTAFRRSIQGSAYRFRSVRINKLERNRSLMEVFKTLSYRRMGLDITI